MQYQFLGTDKPEQHRGWTLRLEAAPGLYEALHSAPRHGHPDNYDRSRGTDWDPTMGVTNFWCGSISYRCAVMDDFGNLVPTFHREMDFRHERNWYRLWPHQERERVAAVMALRQKAKDSVH